MTRAICLGGGGAKGDFEVGAVRLLYERNLRPDILASTSVGSVNAIKLAEGEHPDRPELGLSGLERIWESLQSDADMIEEAPWLRAPEFDPGLRALLTGRSDTITVSEPWQPSQYAYVLEPIIVTLIALGSDLLWLRDTGAPLLESIKTIATEARFVYSLAPIASRLRRDVDLDAIAGWAAAGGRWRIATVSLEAGALRYVTETGAVLERDGTPVTWHGLSPHCAQLAQLVAAKETELVLARKDAKTENDKKAASARLRELRAELDTAQAAFRACVAAQPGTIALTVDLRTAVLASASIPALFGSARMGDENYVDGGIREIVPVRVALDLGADEVYAISASPLVTAPQPAGTYNGAGVAAQLGRSLLDLTLNEISNDDLRQAAPPGKFFVIAPDIDVHGLTTIDPGLIQISRDYGYMRAADTVDGVPRPADPATPSRWTSSTMIARLRVENWRLENRRYGHPDPTAPAADAPVPDPSLQPALDAGKNRLADLLAQRRGFGGPLPAGIDRWVGALEPHPWARGLNEAAFVRQTVPASIPARSSAAVTITMRNTGGTTWQEVGGYRLGSQNPHDNLVWGSHRQTLPGPVSPGEEVTFSFVVRAPASGGAPFQWQMVQDGREWFGARTPQVDVTVVEPIECGQIRTRLNQVRNLITSLIRLRDGLDPRLDQEQIAEVNLQLTQLRTEQGNLLGRKSEIGCLQ